MPNRSPATGAGGSGITCGATIPAASSTIRTATATRTGTSTPWRSESGQTRDLTPYDGVQAILHGLSDRIPYEGLIEINRRDPQYHDLYRVHILTGESRIVVENDLGANRFLTDYDFNPRLAVVIPPDGGAQVLSRSGSGEWEPSMTIGPEDDMTTGSLFR